MNKLKTMSESSFLKLFMAFMSACFIVGAFFMPDRATMISGFWTILSSPAKISTNYFDLGGYAATFLNMGLVGVVLLGLYMVFKATCKKALTFLKTYDIISYVVERWLSWSKAHDWKSCMH